MLITINKAILHIIDAYSNLIVFSEEELDLKSENVFEFLVKHIEKSMVSPDLKEGRFTTNSTFKSDLINLVENKLNFIKLSNEIAQIIGNAVLNSDLSKSISVVICDISVENKNYFVILEFINRHGFTHKVVSEDNKIKNEIINYYSILPNPSQKVDAFAFVNLADFNIKFYDKKLFSEGKDVVVLPELILSCDCNISQKESLKLVKDITKKIADDHNVDVTKTVAKFQSFIADNAEISDYVDLQELNEAIFTSNIMQNAFNEKIIDAEIPSKIHINRDLATKSTKNHKIKTDTGIELSFPIDYSNNKEYIEFINNSDGSISIQLKNISKIINK